VRLLEAAQHRAIDLLAGGVNEPDVVAAGARTQLLMHGLAETDGGLGEPHHQHRAGQVGWDAGRERAGARAHFGRPGGPVPAQHLGDDQKAALGIVPGGEAAQPLKRPHGIVHLDSEHAGRQLDAQHLVADRDGEHRRIA
jgi:hypothetical protein